MTINLADEKKHRTMATDLLGCMEMWGMPRQAAVRVISHMMTLIADPSYPYRDMTTINSEETRNILLATAQNLGKAPS